MVRNDTINKMSFSWLRLNKKTEYMEVKKNIKCKITISKQIILT